MFMSWNCFLIFFVILKTSCFQAVERAQYKLIIAVSSSTYNPYEKKSFNFKCF